MQSMSLNPAAVQECSCLFTSSESTPMRTLQRLPKCTEAQNMICGNIACMTGT